MSARDNILRKVRGALAGGAAAESRRGAVEERIYGAPQGIIPARAQLPDAERIALFMEKARGLVATVERVASADNVPAAVSHYLRQHNLPASVRMGSDRRLQKMPWSKQRALEVKAGASDGEDEVGVSHALRGIAETGTVVLESGPSNPTTINFLTDHHIVVVDAADIAGDMENAFAKVRKKHGKGRMPRLLNFISGPSRSGDVEQKLVLGAHGPRALHLIVVGGGT
ncbi:MAG: lactate utilization protein C [Rhizobiaceae bacterium]